MSKIPSTHPAIVQYKAPVLRLKAEPVLAEEFGTKTIAEMLLAMSTALADCDDGVALAAPQIGISKRIFILSPRAFSNKVEPPSPESLVFINPTISKLASRKQLLDEGCLSVRGYFGKIKRAEKATVEAYDFNGKRFARGASGLLAQIFQHEVDHLDGVLFTDKTEQLEEVSRVQNLESSI